MPDTGTPEIGKAAPAFSAPTDGGGTLALKDLKGKNVVLYFYPKDDTSGCTREAIDFSDLIGKFGEANTEIVGVSKDTPAKHDKFIAKHDLKVRLVSDEDGSICEKYGVWVEKSMYGRKYMGIERSTFLIDDKGKLRNVWRKVKVAGHAEDVLTAVEAL